MQNWQRLRLRISGVVHGVGFRPFVYAAAKKFELTGFVGNESKGVFLEVEGEAENLTHFQNYLRANPPPLAHITTIKIKELIPQSSTDFYIAESKVQSEQTTLVSPDVSVCEDCRRELFDKNDWRFGNDLGQSFERADYDGKRRNTRRKIISAATNGLSVSRLTAQATATTARFGAGKFCLPIMEDLNESPI